LSKILWDVIHGMADLGAFLSYTDHLSDRELYSTLWHETLRAQHPIVPEDYPLATHIDLLGGWSNEATRTFTTISSTTRMRTKGSGLRRKEAIRFPIMWNRRIPEIIFCRDSAVWERSKKPLSPLGERGF